MTRSSFLQLVSAAIPYSVLHGVVKRTHHTVLLLSPQKHHTVQDFRRTNQGYWFLEARRDLDATIPTTRQFVAKADSNFTVTRRFELPSGEMVLSLNVLSSGNLVLQDINGQANETDQSGVVLRTVQDLEGPPFGGQMGNTFFRHTKSGALQAHTMTGSTMQRRSLAGVLPGSESALVQPLGNEVVAVVDRLNPRAAVVNLATGASRTIAIRSPELSSLQKHYGAIIAAAPAEYKLKPVLFPATGVDPSGRLALQLARVGSSPAVILHLDGDGLAVDHTSCLLPERTIPGFHLPRWMFWESASLYVVFRGGGVAVV